MRVLWEATLLIAPTFEILIDKNLHMEDTKKFQKIHGRLKGLPDRQPFLTRRRRP